ncbi:hypothetical protein J7554_04545 [Wohlfahrtiimonas chitiniclastica]|uniref:hypothetical protein n=1 Tax=Wohlfahrtiimonas chitiniclastica TaxID=400946 RepID=UPI001BCB0F85|nr:hypothetical protein [Wohlfahrtiimonas chitiniclastica]MBS7828385.1 hypothetical protein [Wohlfahrtiimonas chitiniclastica]
MIKSRLKQNYTIPELITKIHEDFGELLSEEDIYEYAYNGHIQLSLIIPKDFYYGHTLDVTDQNLEKNKNYSYYSDIDTNDFYLIIGFNLHLSAQEKNYQLLNTKPNEYKAIEDLWDIPTTTHEGKKSDFLSTLHLFTPNDFGNLYDTIPKIELIDPKKERYAIVYKANYRGSLNNPVWSFDDLHPNDAKIVIRKENFDAFIQKINEELRKPKQKPKPLYNIEKENLLRIIGVFLIKGEAFGDLRNLSVNKTAEIIESCLQELQLQEPKKTTITSIIKNARDLIPSEKSK